MMKPTLGLIGGTGHEGSGLARRWAKAGYPVLVGSRDATRAAELAAKVSAAFPGANIKGVSNDDAAKGCSIAVLTVPFAAQRPTLESLREHLQGKILVDVTVPLVPPKVMRVQMPPEGSAALIAQQVLGEGVKVVSAFQNVSSHLLDSEGEDIDCDVLVCSDDKEARAQVVELVSGLGMRGVEAGMLVNSVAAEALTSVLIFMNGFYKLKGAGIRITGLPNS
jgi:NADPH-dependent F420 reductase